MVNNVKFRRGEAKRITHEDLVYAVQRTVALLREPTEDGRPNDAAIPYVQPASDILDEVLGSERLFAEALVDQHEKIAAPQDVLKAKANAAQAHLAVSYESVGLAPDKKTAERYATNFCRVAKHAITSEVVSRQL